MANPRTRNPYSYSLQEYLAAYFIEEQELLTLLGTTEETLGELQRLECLPKASYTLSLGPSLTSFVFGARPLDSTSVQPALKRYYPRCYPRIFQWVKSLLPPAPLSRDSWQVIYQALRGQVGEAILASDYRLYQEKPVVTPDGRMDEGLFGQFFEHLWKHWLEGTPGVCTVEPYDGARLVAKHVAVMRLKKAKDGGKPKKNLSLVEQEELQAAYAQFDLHVMPFSPLDRRDSSRQWLKPPAV